MAITVTYIYEQGHRCGYEATDGMLKAFCKKRYKAIEKLRTLRWESREYAAGRYTVNEMTGEIIYSRTR